MSSARHIDECEAIGPGECKIPGANQPEGYYVKQAEAILEGEVTWCRVWSCQTQAERDESEKRSVADVVEFFENEADYALAQELIAYGFTQSDLEDAIADCYENPDTRVPSWLVEQLEEIAKTMRTISG